MARCCLQDFEDDTDLPDPQDAGHYLSPEGMTQRIYPSSSSAPDLAGDYPMQDLCLPRADSKVASQRQSAHQAVQPGSSLLGLPPRKPVGSQPSAEKSKGLQERGGLGGCGPVWEMRRAVSASSPLVSFYPLRLCNYQISLRFSCILLLVMHHDEVAHKNSVLLML